MQVLRLPLSKHACRGCRIEYLPPYSPEYNPIELMFFLVKYRLRREGQIRRDDTGDDLDVYMQLYNAVFATSQMYHDGSYPTLR